MKKAHLLILPQENLYLKTDGTVYNDVKCVTYLKLKTNLASLYIVVPLLLDLKVEHNLGTEKE